MSAVGQILGTKAQSETTQGELPWRTQFGSLLYLLRIRNNSPALVEVARAFVVRALQEWEPRIRVTRVQVTRKKSDTGLLDKTVIDVKFDVLAQAQAFNQVLVPGLEATIALG